MVQFLGVLSVPVLVASAESPRAMWMAEWVRPQAERTIGILKLRDGRLSFSETVGQAGWELDLTAVKRAVISNGGPSTSLRASALVVESVAGDRYVMTVMDANLTLASPKKVLDVIERAIQMTGAQAFVATNR